LGMYPLLTHPDSRRGIGENRMIAEPGLRNGTNGECGMQTVRQAHHDRPEALEGPNPAKRGTQDRPEGSEMEKGD
jgi:hypothetical protein